MMKKCRRCNRSKRHKEFRKKTQNKDGLDSQCRECHRVNYRKSKRPTGVTKAAIIADHRQKLLKMFKGGCTDCGNNDPRVLEFDHVRGKKRDNVSSLIQQGHDWEVVKKEIAKCEIVCSNCHRIRTFDRLDNCWRT